MNRRLPIGAEIFPGQGVHFRVWAPNSKTAAIELWEKEAEHTVPLGKENDGYFSGLVPNIGAGQYYKIKLDFGSFPDPASRFQPQGPHGVSQVIDPGFAWTDKAWGGRPIEEAVVYELHIGTFTPEGTWRAAAAQLPELVRLGVTVIEMMPVADFPGNFGWGYDGVDLFAPTRLYGSPDDLCAFVNRAHELGLMVILDVVYNHLGPDGNYLGQFSKDYFSDRYFCEWGGAINFDGPSNGPVREFFVSNARYWIDEFHFDGLRLDATQQIYDASAKHILAEITQAARAAAGARRICIFAEDERQRGRLARPCAAGGCGVDSMWSDDYHHTSFVAATGRAEAYFLDYRGTAQELVSAVKYGYLFQGQWYRWQKQRRGQPSFDLSPRNFVFFLENHDQVANSLRGLRLHQLAGPGVYRALTALTLLAPQVPLLFQGQEFAASTPFLYFADHGGELRRLVSEGRRKFMQQFRTAATEEGQKIFPEPADPATFQRCKLDFSEREKNRAHYKLHEDLLRLRRNDPTLTKAERVDGAVLHERVFVLRYFSRALEDRLLLVNLGVDLFLDPAPEPLLAPPENCGWRILWSSESLDYGGSGTWPSETTSNWIIQGQTAVLMGPDPDAAQPDARFSFSEKH